jgi:hypothetical protein
MNVAVVVQGFAAIAWVIVILGVVLIVTRVSRGRNPQPGIVTVLVGVLLALVLTTVSAGLVFIPPDQRGVVISAVAPKGYREEALQPGLRWIVPFLENVESYSISKMTYTMSITQMEGAVIGDDSITARTQDGQEILIDSSVIFSVDPNKTIKVHIEWQKRYINDLVRPLARARHSRCRLSIRRGRSGERPAGYHEPGDQGSHACETGGERLVAGRLRAAQHYLLIRIRCFSGTKANRRAVGSASQADC